MRGDGMTTDPRYQQPNSVQAAWELLKEGPHSARVAWTSPKPDPFEATSGVMLVDLSQLGLDEFGPDGMQIIIGSMTPLTQLHLSGILSLVFGGIIPRAARKTAHHGLRNLATVGGVVENPRGSPEIATSLLASGAVLRLYDGSETSLPLSEYLVAGGSGARPGIVLALELDAPAGETAMADIQWVVRSPMDQALIVSACSFQHENGKITSPRVAVASDGLAPQRLDGLEKDLEGKELPSVTLEFVRQAMKESVNPTDSFRCPADYQREMAVVLAQRGLTNAAQAEVSHEG
jgi:CO/xanthine dehydrogenase FAD-binding subunit